MIQKPIKSQKPSIYDSAWAAYESENTVKDLDQIRKEGWRTVKEIAKITGLSECQVAHKCGRDKSLEGLTEKVFFSGRARRMNFYRPKPSGVSDKHAG